MKIVHKVKKKNMSTFDSNNFFLKKKGMSTFVWLEILNY